MRERDDSVQSLFRGAVFDDSVAARLRELRDAAIFDERRRRVRTASRRCRGRALAGSFDSFIFVHLSPWKRFYSTRSPRRTELADAPRMALLNHTSTTNIVHSVHR